MILFLAMILATAVVAFVLYPVIAGAEAPMGGGAEELTDAQHRKKMALMALRDVEYDFHAGKLDEKDYRAMKRRISAEALTAIEAEKAEWERRPAAAAGSGSEVGRGEDPEAEIARLREAIREGVICPHCAHPNPRGSRFCGECGSALPRNEGPAGGGSAGDDPSPREG